MNNTVLKKWYIKNINRWIPEYGLLSLIACFAVSGIVYWGAQLLMKDAYHYDFTTALDSRVPFVKEWVVIYIGCYAFWILNYILISHKGKEEWYRFVFADIISKIICGIFFILLPTTNIRPEVLGNDCFSRLMINVYQNDPPTNLFPSIHCMVSWLCYTGIRSSKKIPTWYKTASLIIAVLVCLSTQFTKQHILIDAAGGILIAEISFYAANHTQIYRGIERFFDNIGRKLFGAAYYEKTNNF